MKTKASKVLILTLIFVLTAVACVLPMSAAEYKTGDMNGDGQINSDDAIYLLRHTLDKDKYSINQPGDVNGNGDTTSDDAIYLLRYTLNQENYPLECQHDYVNGECIHCGIENIIQYSQGLEFVSNGDGTCYVSGIGTCEESNIVIPQKSPVGDIVTSIGESAFLFCDGLTSVIISDSIAIIENEAFYGCDNLTSVTIGDSVTSIGCEAFRNCTSLTSVTIGDSVTSIGSYAFVYCDSLTSVYITDLAAWCNLSFKTIYSNPLYYANNLYLNGELATELVIPDSVTSIGNYAFYNCDSFTSVSIPESVTIIGIETFYNCGSLENVTLSDSVTSIGWQAFYNCTSLANVYITDLAAWCRISFETSSSNPLCYADNLYINNKLVTDLVIPDSVISIGREAFVYCDSLTSVTVGDSVTSIGSNAFFGCNSLKSIVFEDLNEWYRTDNYDDWENKTNGTQTDVSDNALNATCFTETYSGYYWYFVDKEDVLTASEGLEFTSNGDGTCYVSGTGTCEDTDIMIPQKSPNGDTVTSIGASAFESCDRLVRVEIPGGVTSIGNSAFSDCKDLAEIKLSESVKLIGEYAFKNCISISQISIPPTCTSLGAYCFSGATNLTVTIDSAKLTFIGANALTNVADINWNGSTSWQFKVKSGKAWIYPYLEGDIGQYHYKTVTDQLISVNLSSSTAKTILKRQKDYYTNSLYNDYWGYYKLTLCAGSYDLIKIE